MQTALEVRWFLKGIPPEAVQHWFKSECPEKLLTSEAQTREDRYACGDLDKYLNKFQKFAPNLVGDWAQLMPYAKRYPLGRDRINLKLREGNLELKLRTEQFGIQTFTAKNDCIWSGRVEQWRKFNLQQLKDAAFDRDRLNLNWIRVRKERLQKNDRGVDSELTWLEAKGSAWWSIAFEMTQEDNAGVDLFCEVVEQAALTCSEPKLLARDSYSYADWLDKFIN